MDKDIVPELLEKIQNEFKNKTTKSEIIKNKIAALNNNKATHKDSNEFAVEVGKILADVFKDEITSDILPDGKMYYNIAKRLIEPNMKNNYEIVSDYSRDVQKVLNKESNISLKAIKPELNQDRIDGIVNKICEYDDFKKGKWLLEEPIKNFTQSIVDDTIKTNADFQYKSGLTPKIVRKEVGSCCDWCKEVVGVYEYPDVPKDVFRRHRFCRCTVDYLPGNGKKQDVWSKKWTGSDNDEKIQGRIKFSEQRKNYKIADNKTEENLLKQSDKNWKKLLGSEQNAIYEYSGSAYDIINKYLRGVTTEEDARDIEYYQVKQSIKEIDRALSRNKLGQDLVLYRGVSSEEYISWLNTNFIDTYKSTSISKETFKHFGDGHRIIIHAPKSTKGFYIGNHSNYRSEKEFLIHRGQKYKILSNKEGVMEVEIIE